MAEKKKIQENINAELGGMGIYGTTSNAEVAGYQMSGDIENAGQLHKGFAKEEGHAGATASFKDSPQRD
ncbi:hypothetical protein ACFOU2_21600 [Bacillus songklensis]|uniref:Small, acid-soluble spore protein, alpha/beta type n=1 Tax=Bacillus songklensis TaxID=1069116 RepID=A0ABV8B9V8_9BACI